MLVHLHDSFSNKYMLNYYKILGWLNPQMWIQRADCKVTSKFLTARLGGQWP